MAWTLSLSVLISILTFLNCAQGHGYLAKPPARNALFTMGYTDQPPNYDVMSLNAGGVQAVAAHEHGICGDPFKGERKHEAGGLYANGFIPEESTFTSGEVIDTRVIITAMHKGRYMLRLCDLENPNKLTPETEECFDQHILQRADGQGPFYTFNNEDGTGTYDMQFRLPYDVACERCVVQWWWEAANSPGSPHQEEFWNCADIKISGVTNTMTSLPITTTNLPTTVTITASVTTTTSPPDPTTTTSSLPDSTTSPTTTASTEMKCVSKWAHIPDSWCEQMPGCNIDYPTICEWVPK